MLLTMKKHGIDIPEMYQGRYEFEFGIRFFLGGFVDVYTQWLKGEMDCTMEDIIQSISRMVVKVYREVK